MLHKINCNISSHVCHKSCFILKDYPKCTDKQFECKNFRCISKSLVCNGEDNCRDGNKTDEIHCRKSSSCPTIIIRV